MRPRDRHVRQPIDQERLLAQIQVQRHRKPAHLLRTRGLPLARSPLEVQKRILRMPQRRQGHFRLESYDVREC